jgi:hypothetical protein
MPMLRGRKMRDVVPVLFHLFVPVTLVVPLPGCVALAGPAPCGARARE